MDKISHCESSAKEIEIGTPASAVDCFQRVDKFVTEDYPLELEKGRLGK